MGVIKWRGLLGPPSLVISAALVIAAVVPAAIAAGPLRPSPAPIPPCPPAGVPAAGDLAGARGASVKARIIAEAIVTARGEETGRRLSIKPPDGPPIEITLPAESFTAGPFGGLLLYGSHTPATGSEVRVVDVANGCDRRLATPSEIVRSASLDDAGSALYVHSVTRDERRDEGVVRHDLTTGITQRVVEALPDSDVYGPTFATSLVWSADGRELAVQSCGFSKCRTRILDTDTGAVESVPGRGHGSLLGLDRERLYAFDACHWSPCDVLGIERAAGTARVLVEEAYEAELRPGEDGVLRMVVDTGAGIWEFVP